MAIRKSELYSSLWASCDELRGSMDASQYKDYVLVLLFMKYVSDKGDRLVNIPKGGSFKDMVKLKGDQILVPLSWQTAIPVVQAAWHLLWDPRTSRLSR